VQLRDVAHPGCKAALEGLVTDREIELHGAVGACALDEHLEQHLAGGMLRQCRVEGRLVPGEPGSVEEAEV